MTWLLIGVVIFWGGIGFGIVMLLGVMLYEGRWTLPGTAAREMQKLRVRQAIELFDIESEQRRQSLEDLYDDRARKALMK